MSLDDWNEYFETVFQGAWDCYSDPNGHDGKHKELIKKGARWATDFQQRVLEENAMLKSDLKWEQEVKLIWKSKYNKLIIEFEETRMLLGELTRSINEYIDSDGSINFDNVYDVLDKIKDTDKEK